VASGRARFVPAESYAEAIPHQPRPVRTALGSWTGLHGRKSRLHLCGYRASRTRDPVAGRLAYPAPLMTFRPFPARASRVFPSRAPPPAEASGRRPSWPYRLLQSARWSAGTPSRRSLLSWDSSVSLPSAYLQASTPRSRSPLRTSAATRRFTFHPRGFAPPRWFSPHWSYGSVAPRNRPRVRRVSCMPPTRSVRRRLESPGSLPATRFTPFEDFPSPAAAPHHCGRCLPAVTVLPGAASDRSRLPCRPPPTEVRSVHPCSRWVPFVRKSSGSRGMGCSALRRARGSLSLGWGAPFSEEPGVPCPDEAVPRRSEELPGPWSRVTRHPTRRSEPRTAPRRSGPCLQARDPCVPPPGAAPPRRPVSWSRGMGFPFVRRVVDSLSREVGRPKLRRAPGSLPRRGGVRRAPKSPEFPAPCGRLAVLRRAPSTDRA